jgi:hypothetical protein
LSAMLFIVTERDWVWRVFSVVMMGLLWFLGKGEKQVQSQSLKFDSKHLVAWAWAASKACGES